MGLLFRIRGGKRLPGEHVAELNQDRRVSTQIIITRVIAGGDAGWHHDGQRDHQAGAAVLATLGDQDAAVKGRDSLGIIQPQTGALAGPRARRERWK